MKQVFADTLYWVASIAPGDPWHVPALRAVAELGPVQVVTTEEVLVEFLSAYARRGEYLRGKAVQTARHRGECLCGRAAADARDVRFGIGLVCQSS
jgi:predicted nucleic acid-binding protein